jgi:hypothetical protein
LVVKKRLLSLIYQNGKTMKTTTIEQSNTYRVYDSMGRGTSIYIVASNIKDACKEAKARQKEIGSAYYKVKRAYNGGVRGSQL